MAESNGKHRSQIANRKSSGEVRGVCTVKLILQGDRRSVVRVQQRAERVWVEAELAQLALNFLETFLQLAVGNGMVNPVRREVCAGGYQS